MKILIITPRIPFPPYKGDKLKIYNVGKQLLKNNSVTIITFLRSKKQFKDIEELKRLNFNVIYVKISILESCLSVLKAIFNKVPFQVAWYDSARMKKQINNLIYSGNYDVAYFHLIRTAQYLPPQNLKTQTVKVIDFTDAVSLYLNRFFIIEKNPFKKFLLRIEKSRIEKYEIIANNFDLVFICSKIDKDYLVKQGVKSKIKILRNGVDIKQFSPRKINCEKNRIVFTGNMPYYANYDAVLFFVKEIFPHIIKQIPDAKFYIVGQNPPRKIRDLASNNVFVTGFVQEIQDEYLKSVVNVAPMRFGAGTLNKIIESIVLGVPVIATPIAVEGFPNEIKNVIQVASEPEEFANEVIKYLRNPELREQFMQLDKSVIKEILNWEHIVTQFESDLNEQIKKVQFGY